MWEFFSSNLLQTLITIFVGFIAYLVYLKQRKDQKKDAATAILLEIQNAEKVISKVEDSVRNGRLEIDYTVVQNDPWKQYQHLFTRDFDKDEWEAISEFFNKAKLLDEAIRYNHMAFGNDVEQIRANKQRVLADFAKDLINESIEKMPLGQEKIAELVAKFDNKIKAFDQTYMSKQGEFGYSPMKPINDAKIYLEDLRPLSTTTVGLKLKEITKYGASI